MTRKTRSIRWILMFTLAAAISAVGLNLTPSFDARADGGVITLSEFSNAAPALASFNGKLYLAWTGTDGRLNVMSSFEGVSFSNKVILGEFSNAGPALASFNGKLYLAWTGTDGRLNVMSSFEGVSFSNKVILGEFSNATPALVNFNGKLVLAWTGTDGQLNVMSSFEGVSFSNKVVLGESSFTAPALGVSNGSLLLAWAGRDGAQSLNILSSSNGVTFGGKALLGESSFAAPALADTAGNVALAWTGTDGAHHLNVFRALGGAKDTLGQTSNAAPALASHNGQLFMAWAGTDAQGRLNLQSLTGGSSASTPSEFRWQWPDLSVASAGKICVLGICASTGGSVNQAYAFPADVADGVSRLGVQSARRMESNLPNGLSFDLSIPSRSATLNGTVSSSVGLRLVYDLLNSSGGKVASLTVLVNLQLSGGGPTPTPTPTPSPSPSGCNPCKVNLIALIQGSGGTFTSVSGVPITVNGSSYSTPSLISGPAGAAITLQAPSSIKVSGKTYAFKEWRSDVTGPLSNKNPLKGAIDRNETIQAIYAAISGGGGSNIVTLTIRAINGNNKQALPVNIGTSCCGSILTPASLTVSAGASVTLTAPEKVYFGLATLNLKSWKLCSGATCTGFVVSGLPFSTGPLKANTEIEVVYK